MKIRRKCLCCNNSNLKEIIDLGFHSFADRFIPKNKLKSIDPSYPLILDFCNKCKFIQSRVITNPKNRYIDIDYSYTSSNSNYSKNHWNEFAKQLNRKFKIQDKKILEIGSNDGYLCSLLNKFGAKTLGVDASNFMVNLSRKIGVKSIHSIFSYKESLKIKKKYGNFDIIIANNVFNHSDFPNKFLKGVSNLLNPNGIYVFEQPDFTIGAASLKFDQIYHEHVSYFTSLNIKTFLNKNKFRLIDINKNEYHGGSLRTYAIKNTSDSYKRKFTLEKFKKDKTVNTLNFFKKMNKDIQKKRLNLLKKIHLFLQNGYTICGVGAGAKANTFLTYYSLDNKIITFLTDASKFKKNKFTPITRIPIKDDNQIKKYKKIVCLILSWNISSLIIKKIKKLNKKAIILNT